MLHDKYWLKYYYKGFMPSKPSAMKIILKRMGKGFFYSGIILELILITLMIVQWVLFKEIWPTCIIGALIVPSVFIYVRRSTYPLTRKSLPGERVWCILQEQSELMHKGVVEYVYKDSATVRIEDDVYVVKFEHQLHNKFL